jgi:hypothetical protein
MTAARLCVRAAFRKLQGTHKRTGAARPAGGPERALTHVKRAGQAGAAQRRGPAGISGNRLATNPDRAEGSDASHGPCARETPGGRTGGTGQARGSLGAGRPHGLGVAGGQKKVRQHSKMPSQMPGMAVTIAARQTSRGGGHGHVEAHPSDVGPRGLPKASRGNASGHGDVRGRNACHRGVADGGRGGAQGQGGGTEVGPSVPTAASPSGVRKVRRLNRGKGRRKSGVKSTRVAQRTAAAANVAGGDPGAGNGSGPHGEVGDTSVKLRPPRASSWQRRKAAALRNAAVSDCASDQGDNARAPAAPPTGGGPMQTSKQVEGGGRQMPDAGSMADAAPPGGGAADTLEQADGGGRQTPDAGGMADAAPPGGETAGTLKQTEGGGRATPEAGRAADAAPPSRRAKAASKPPDLMLRRQHMFYCSAFQRSPGFGSSCASCSNFIASSARCNRKEKILKKDRFKTMAIYYNSAICITIVQLCGLLLAAPCWISEAVQVSLGALCSHAF